MPNVFAQRWSSEAYAGPSSSKRLAVCVAIRCSVALRSGFVLLTSAAECCRLITVCADVTKASCWRPRRCRRLRAAERQLLQLHPLCMDADEAEKFECRSARRALASAAQRMGLTPPEVAALGNWRGALPTEGEKSKAMTTAICKSMAVRYDQGRLMDSAKAGQMVVEGIRLAVQTKGHWNLSKP